MTITCCIFMTPFSTSSASRLGLLKRGALSDGKLALNRPSLTPTDSTAEGICIYYFIAPSYFRFRSCDLSSLIYTGASLIDDSLKDQYVTLPPITKLIQIRRTRHAGHCWRSKDELISDVLPWTPSHGGAKVGRPAGTYTQQLCVDTGCSLEDLPEAMADETGSERGSGRSMLAA